MSPPEIDVEAVAARLALVRARIDAVTTDPSAVRLVAVTKGFGVDAVDAALGLGLTDIGENYADELLSKSVSTDGATWHFLGRVQRNKVGRLAPVVGCWQGVCRVEEGRAIAARHPGASVLVQVDLAGIAGRNGCDPGQVPELIRALRDEDLDVAGLMAVGPPGPPETARAGFRSVAALADRLDLPIRSMGMTDDLEVALSEGSTMVRLGRALFGDRPPKERGDHDRSGVPG